MDELLKKIILVSFHSSEGTLQQDCKKMMRLITLRICTLAAFVARWPVCVFVALKMIMLFSVFTDVVKY